MKSIIFLFTTVVVFISCAKEKHTYMLSGRMLKDCSGTPLANTKVRIFQGVTGSLTSTSGGAVGEFTTDAEGKFSTTYKSENGYTLRLLDLTPIGSYGELMSNIPGDRDVKDILIYGEPKYNFQLSLNVLNPHSAGDTLFITNLSTGQFTKVACPLTNGILYSIADTFLPAMGYNESVKTIIWNFKINPYDPPKSKNIVINKYCSDTVKATIDIN